MLRTLAYLVWIRLKTYDQDIVHGVIVEASSSSRILASDKKNSFRWQNSLFGDGASIGAPSNSISSWRTIIVCIAVVRLAVWAGIRTKTTYVHELMTITQLHHSMFTQKPRNRSERPDSLSGGCTWESGYEITVLALFRSWLRFVSFCYCFHTVLTVTLALSNDRSMIAGRKLLLTGTVYLLLVSEVLYLGKPQKFLY